MLSRLYLITNSRQASAPLPTVLRACFDAGATFVQLREKHLSHREISVLAEHLVPLAHDHGAQILVNTYADIAHKTGADGVHLPTDRVQPDLEGLPPKERRAIIGGSASSAGRLPPKERRAIIGGSASSAGHIIGVSTHSLAEAKAAEQSGADFVTLSPIFETASKPGYGPALGLDELARVCKAIDIPVYALAGITPERVEACLDAGAYGVAVMGGVMRAEDVGGAVGAYLEALRF
ncbi:thiamine phosphate synthase [Persicimonas caeni]|uniref:Thiamine-phosphate synthase n=1 Tax=Persicimonas caeni TaxID=2292766 RepID=A0A4Y6PUL3_PERCE|nr:thiamine phosphate synthase [Persicimonas caeni]QDG52034.1 thiamine phosphate synthase [Persicimonas caeni]QED33255.1 thiamine phosphate synthase [Persicimonas caeni]